MVMEYSFPLRFVPVADPVTVQESPVGLAVRFQVRVLLELRVANVASGHVTFMPSSTIENETADVSLADVFVKVRVPSSFIPSTV